MRSYRCFTESDLAADSVLLDEDERRHLVTVLRAREGDDVVVVNGRGAEAPGRIAGIGKRDVRVEIAGEVRVAPPPQHRLGLAAVVTKSADFDDMVQRAVELGMTDFFPARSEHSAVDLSGERAEKRVAKWQRLAIESIKQCERLWLPTVYPVRGWQEHHRLAPAGTCSVILAERDESATPLAELVRAGAGAPLLLFIGPEGGWSTAEHCEAFDLGFKFAHLGTDAILRAETAALAALAIASN